MLQWGIYKWLFLGSFKQNCKEYISIKAHATHFTILLQIDSYNALLEM